MGIVAKYKFDGSVYADLIPEFNVEFTDYTVTDEVDSENSNHIIRTIESDSSPTLMRFGIAADNANDRTNSLKEVLYLDTGNLSSLFRMFSNCRNVTKINTSNWNTSKVTDMSFAFHNCTKLTSLDVSSFDTSNVTNMQQTFMTAPSLKELDLSNWNTSKVSNVQAMFYYTTLQKLDISNFNLGNVNISNSSNISYFITISTLTDIGMIYCDQSTINKVASLLPTDHNITIWVESDDILQYDQYDHITYKTQKVQDTVHLNSPLLKGDTIEVIDGKTYHVHRWEKVVLDGSEGIDKYYLQDERDSTLRFNISNILINSGINWGLALTNTLPYLKCTEGDIEGCQILGGVTGKVISIGILRNKLSTPDVNGFKQWLSENPTTILYQLATPYYELISEEPLELTLLDTTDNTINNNSILPSNMTIANKELSTIAIKPSTIYTLSFDKSNEDSEVTIDICGGEQITTVLNRIELTTPSELGSGIRFISSDGCIVSNVRLLEGILVENAIPKETFEGLKNSFEDGYIIGENLAINTNRKTLVGSTGDRFYYTQTNIIKDTVYTVYCKLSNIINVSEFKAVYSVNGSDETVLLKSNISKDNNTVLKSFVANGNSNLLLYIDAHAGQLDVSDLVILEGDHTHLSEAELMRYIEKGTSHYEEEDYNHVGKYKVQYKVTGKNKFDLSKLKINTQYGNINNSTININTASNYAVVGFYEGRCIYEIGKTYTLSCTINSSIENIDAYVQICTYDEYGNKLLDKLSHGSSNTFTIPGKSYTMRYIVTNATNLNVDIAISNIQIEEGTVATEYEPYKEDIKTYYLSSPLLEGDTIEDVNEVATHVKRYGKVVLDGNKNWAKESVLETTVRYVLNNTEHKFMQGTGHNGIKAFSNYNIGSYSYNNTDYIHFHFEKNKLNFFMDVKYEDITTFKSMLNENPLIVVAKLFSPIYEPISTESILCDSYVNGHLDVDTNIPIEKVYFDYLLLALKYVKPSTRYLLQFESDNVGMSTINIGGSTVSEVPIIKGINKVEITTLPTLTHQLLAFSGIGFNASNIQVVETNEDIEFDYFKGLQSSFESELVTDENDENYGKYKVECKIVGKNKFNGELINGSINNDFGELTFSTGAMDSVVTANPIKVKSGTTYCISNDLNYSNYIYEYDFNMNYLNYYKFNNTSSFTTLNNTCYVRVRSIGSKTENDLSVKYQLEEGTQATPYEPYKESIHTLYLNSPLLKGDKLVVHDGKLCHYHKMGMVVLDGSEDEGWVNFVIESSGKGRMLLNIKKVFSLKFCDKLVILPWNNSWNINKDFIASFISGDATTIVPYITAQNANEFRQWLQANPTTIVYELAEPYYEPIEPQLSQYSFSTVKEGDMDIITVLPIEKINLTYRTDINGVSSIEEQIASIQEGTDISSIIDEEVDE